MAGSRPTLPSGDGNETSPHDFVGSRSTEPTDPLDIARHGLVELGAPQTERRRLFGRRKSQDTPVASTEGGAARARDPLAVLNDALDESGTSTQTTSFKPWAVPVEDLPEPPTDEVFQEASATQPTPEKIEEPAPAAADSTPPATTDAPTASAAPSDAVEVLARRRERPAVVVPDEEPPTPDVVAPAADVAVTAETSIATAAVRGTFPRRGKDPLATSAEPAPSQLEKAEQDHTAAVARAHSVEQQAQAAREAVETATQRAEEAEKLAAETGLAAAEAQQTATEHANKIDQLQTQLAEAEVAASSTEDAVKAAETRADDEAQARAKAQAQVLEALQQRDAAVAQVAALQQQIEELTRAEAQARRQAEELAVESSQASARALAEAKARQIAEETARTQAAALVRAEAKLRETEAKLAAAEDAAVQARTLAMQAADQVVAAAAARLKAETERRTQAEERATAAETKLREAAERDAAEKIRRDAEEQARAEAAAAEMEAKRREASEATAALRAVADSAQGGVATPSGSAEDAVTDDWTFAELQSAHWADSPATPVAELGDVAGSKQPRNEGTASTSENQRRGIFHLRRAKAEEEPVASEPGRTPVETLAEYVAAQGLDVPSELRHTAPEESSGEAEEPSAAPDDLWNEPDSDADDTAEEPRSRGLLRHRSTSDPEPDNGPVDLEPEVTGTMEAADTRQEAQSAESTDHPAHEEQQVSEETGSNEQAEEHVWTAAELAAEGWTTEDLKGAGWTDAHLESIGWPLGDSATEDSDSADVEAEAADETGDEPTPEAEADVVADVDDTTDTPEDSAEAPVAEAAVEDEPTLPGMEDTTPAPVEDSSTDDVDDDDEPQAAEVATEPEAVAEPEPTPVVEPEPEPEPTAIPAAAIPALTMQDLTPDEIERALMLGESLSDILARKNAALQTSAGVAATGPVSPATASTEADAAPSGTEPSPESNTSPSGGGDRGGDDSDDPDPDPAVALFAPPVTENVVAPAEKSEESTVDEPESWDDFSPVTFARTAETPVNPVEKVEVKTEPLAAIDGAERIEYRPGNTRRYLFGGAFIAAAVLSVVAVFWAIQNPGIAPSITAGCLVVLTGALWWALMAWTPRVIAIGQGILEFSQGGHVERFNLLDPETNIAVGPDPSVRSWRAEVIRSNGTKIVIRPDDVRPQQFSSLVAQYREQAHADPVN